MKYRYLGSSGLAVSRVTLSTMTFGAPDWGCDEDKWNLLEEQTRPEEGYHAWFNKRNCERVFSTSEYHDERRELP